MLFLTIWVWEELFEKQEAHMAHTECELFECLCVGICSLKLQVKSAW